MDDSARLRKALEKVKSEIHLKEGEMNALVTRLKDDFKINTVEEAYGKFDSISSDIEELEHKKSQLLLKARMRLQRYSDDG